MKAIVVRQPWATLIALGIKTIETRPAPPNGPMRPDGVRGLPGLPLERGEWAAIVAGKAKPAGGVPGWEVERTDYMGHGEQRWVAWHWDTPGQSVTATGYDLPLGSVVCTVRVDDALPIVAPMTDPPHDHLVPTSDGHLMWWRYTPVLGQRRWSAASRHPMLNERTVVGGRRDPDLDPQLPLGDFTPGRWGWMLSDPQPCDPIPCKGRQGVFELPADVAEALEGGR